MDIQARLRDSSGNLLIESNPLNELDAFLSWNVASPANFIVEVEGTGQTGLYSDYASLGFYTLEAKMLKQCLVGDVNMDGSGEPARCRGVC